MGGIHVSIFGVTLSGKTTLARAICRQLDAAGHNTIVFDPVLSTETAGGGWGENSVVFDDEDAFWEYMEHPDVKGAHVFIDESGDQFNLSKRENFWLLTRGRHWHLFVYMIAQRPTMIAPTIRTSAARCYMFRLAPKDAEEIGNDMGHAGIGKIMLDTGDFIVIDSGQAKIMPVNNIFQLLEKEI